MPGRAAYMDGRRGSSSMRLNFAGVPDEDIREGIRRIGKVMGGDTGLLGTLTGAVRRPRATTRRRRGARGDAADAATPLADVVALPRRERAVRSARRRKDR